MDYARLVSEESAKLMNLQALFEDTSAEYLQLLRDVRRSEADLHSKIAHNEE